MQNRAFLLVETTVCCWFCYWSEVQVFRKTIIVQSTYTSVIEWSQLKWMGVTATVQCMTQLLGFTVVMWQHSEIWLVCQLSGSGSNSLNLRKLPGCFSHGLGTRQSNTWTDLLLLPSNMETWRYHGYWSYSSLTASDPQNPVNFVPITCKPHQFP